MIDGLKFFERNAEKQEAIQHYRRGEMGKHLQRCRKMQYKTSCFTLPRNRLTMGKAAFYDSKTTCFTGMTLYDTF